jgi:hypothetical protein
MAVSSRPRRWSTRYLADGPIAEECPADRHKIAELIQRGRAVPDARLVPQALAYARFRGRFCAALGVMFVLLAAGDVVVAATDSGAFRLVPAAVSLGFLVSGALWLWLASRCRQGARATTRCAGREGRPGRGAGNAGAQCC